ncbi:MAG: class I SAM-dependent methyltransferase, partial [Chloroflexi bacterium]|nr:class I SAM-dependent methyltransferase [Chloroflexota bacterium]
MSMPTDPRRIVADGYDAAADDYARWLVTGVVDTGRPKYLAHFCSRLPEGASVLELGCGGGGPTTAELARRFALTGVDLSSRQITLARERLPTATFVHADMTRFETPPSSVDGVAAFYSLIHLPYGELPAMFARIARWLRPGGVFVASLGARAGGEHVEREWL